MRNEILKNTGDAEALEKLYNSNKKAFRAAFYEVFPEIGNTETARVWKARLEYESGTDILKTFPLSELLIVIAVCLIPAFLIKIPAIFPSLVSEDIFLQRNISLIVFLGLAVYTMWRNNVTDLNKIILTGVAFLIPSVYINLLPGGDPGDSIILAFIHLPVLMLYLFGFIFANYDYRNTEIRIEFIRHAAELVIVFGLIAIAGGILTAITINLFSSIGLDIENIYTEYIVATGAAAAPVFASWLLEKYPNMVSRIAPVIAGIFSPLVLLTLIIFLLTFVISGKDPYNDRDFLIIFNVMLLGVMAIIIFSVSETSVIRKQKFNAAVLFALSIFTIVIDLIALSAIFYRLGEYGMTPNRLAVLVSNILVLGNLILIMTDLFRINFRSGQFSKVETTVARYLPVYLIWVLIVTFGFPLFFGMK
ncbi:MAG TPA: hypothetical protein PL123_10555 [Bacteroidales bacterium]|nr:hypothetical protein [Bacteroidales bacterium]